MPLVAHELEVTVLVLEVDAVGTIPESKVTLRLILPARSCLLCGLPLAPNVNGGSVAVFSMTGGGVTVMVTVTTETVGVQ